MTITAVTGNNSFELGLSRQSYQLYEVMMGTKSEPLGTAIIIIIHNNNNDDIFMLLSSWSL